MNGIASVHLAETETEEPLVIGVDRGPFFLVNKVRIRKEPKRFSLVLPFGGIQHEERQGRLVLD